MRFRSIRIGRLLVGLLIFGLAVLLPALLTGGGKSAAKPDLRSALYALGPGIEANESLTKLDQYWSDRLTYPTGVFRQR